MNLTSEQENIVFALQDNNVIVNAVAGAGKTTLALAVAEHYAPHKCLLLTYNKLLQENTALRAAEMKIPLQAYTMHGLFGRLMNRPCNDDYSFEQMLTSDCINNPTFLDHDLLIVDEMQDMRQPYFEFLVLILKIKPTRIMLVGDINQLIYDFLPEFPASPHFLQQADYLLKDLVNSSFINMKMTRSFRTSPKIASFINRTIQPKPELVGTYSCNLPVEFLICNPRSNKIVQHIANNIREFGASNVMLLSHSHKNVQMKHIMKALVKCKIPFTCQKSFTVGKVMIQTFCSAKGLERPVVYVFNSGKIGEKSRSSNPLYVALTRAKGKLIIAHSKNQKIHPCFRSIISEHENGVISDDVTVNFLGNALLAQDAKSWFPKELLISQLFRFQYLTPYLDVVSIESSGANYQINLPTCIEFSYGIEDVTMLVGESLRSIFCQSPISQIDYKSKFALGVTRACDKLMKEYPELEQIQDYKWIDNIDYPTFDQLTIIKDKLKPVAFNAKLKKSMKVLKLIDQADFIDDTMVPYIIVYGDINAEDKLRAISCAALLNMKRAGIVDLSTGEIVIVETNRQMAILNTATEAWIDNFSGY